VILLSGLGTCYGVSEGACYAGWMCVPGCSGIFFSTLACFVVGVKAPPYNLLIPFFLRGHVAALDLEEFPRLPRVNAPTSPSTHYLFFLLVVSKCTLRGTLLIHGVFNGMHVFLQPQPSLNYQLLLCRVPLPKALLSYSTSTNHVDYLSDVISDGAIRGAVLRMLND